MIQYMPLELVTCSLSIQDISVAGGWGGGGGGQGKQFVGTCKPTSMSFVTTKYLKYRQNIERNSSFRM